MRHKDKNSGLVFRWEGGAYIEIAQPYSMPFEVINVWSHAANKPSIPYERKHLVAAAQSWLKTQSPEAIELLIEAAGLPNPQPRPESVPDRYRRLQRAVRKVLAVRDAEREGEASTEDLLDAIATLEGVLDRGNA